MELSHCQQVLSTSELALPGRMLRASVGLRDFKRGGPAGTLKVTAFEAGPLAGSS